MFFDKLFISLSLITYFLAAKTLSAIPDYDTIFSLIQNPHFFMIDITLSAILQTSVRPFFFPHLLKARTKYDIQQSDKYNVTKHINLTSSFLTNFRRIFTQQSEKKKGVRENKRFICNIFFISVAILKTYFCLAFFFFFFVHSNHLISFIFSPSFLL